jgi:HEAT repeat protein
LARPRPGGGQDFRDLGHTVERDLSPAFIINELRKGDYVWGAWLAFLRPHADVVPALLDHLKTSSEHRDETLLALGASGDKRAFPVLLKHLQSGDRMASGFAATALAYFGDSATEAALIDALRKSDGVWATSEMCAALGAIGTTRSLEPLQEVARSPLRGAISAPAAAKVAIQKIEARLAHAGGADAGQGESEPSDAAESR